ncbi:MAG: nucleotide exchange factor GrpE [Oscillospiraceae bacterium]|nr:nucleotide exchange factor GrpE [Oscillospiraceae bacterium]
MSKKNKNQHGPEPKQETVNEEPVEQTEPETAAQEAPAAEAPETPKQEAPETEAPQPDETEQLRQKLAAEHDLYLRLAAEYDNFRKRSRKEKEALYLDVKAETAGKFLPVFDDLERALANETADEAYKKGVELIMSEFRKIIKELGGEEFGETGDPFDPNAHNAVMHVEDESLGENVVAQVFQKGFRIGEKVLRHAVVKVAN